MALLWELFKRELCLIEKQEAGRGGSIGGCQGARDIASSWRSLELQLSLVNVSFNLGAQLSH
jgi:hypothetical protein